MSNKEPDKLRKRVLTALVVAPPCLFAAYYGSWPFMIMILIFFAIAMQEWFALAQKLGGMRAFIPGTLYLLICFYCFYVVGAEKNIDALLLIVLIASSDIGAYFAGKTIGGPKMAKTISPNKTWAGLGGAVLAPAIVLLLAEILFLDYLQKGVYEYLLFFVFGCLIGLCGQLGDILVSLMKRKAKVKDTGTLLPGHGGVLDRIDSLLLASPVFMALEYVIGHV